MHYAIKKLIREILAGNITEGAYAPSTADFRLKDIDDFSAFVITYSPHGFKIKLRLGMSGQVERDILPRGAEMQAIEKTQLYSYEELRGLVTPKLSLVS